MSAGMHKLASLFSQPVLVLGPVGGWQAHRGICAQFLLLVFTVLKRCPRYIPEMCWVWS